MNDTETPEKTRDELKSLADRISQAIRRGKFTATELEANLVKRAGRGARAANELVHEFAWTALGVGIGFGFLTGIIAGRATQTASGRSQAERARAFRLARQERDEEAEDTLWDKFQTVLPLAILALKTFSELRASRRHSRQ